MPSLADDFLFFDSKVLEGVLGVLSVSGAVGMFLDLLADFNDLVGLTGDARDFLRDLEISLLASLIDERGLEKVFVP